MSISASAHKASDAYLTIDWHLASIRGQWDIALRDLDNAIGLDGNGDGDVTWRKVRERRSGIAAYALSRLVVSSGSERCALVAGDQLIDTHTDGAYVVLMFTGTCPQAGPTLSIDYRLFEGLDPQHRGLLNLLESGKSQSVVFSADSPRQVVGGDSSSPLRRFALYLKEGMWHIWSGYDHILFLLSLLLPAVLVRTGRTWLPAQSFKMRSWTLPKW